MLRITLGAIALATFAAQAQAESTQAQAESALPQQVSDGFYVTLEEVRENSSETFMAFAGPGGGPVSREEFISTELGDRIGSAEDNTQLLDRLFGHLDVDGNGQLTREEWSQQINKDLSFADANDDGRITLKELSNARENMSVGDAIGMLF